MPPLLSFPPGEAMVEKMEVEVAACPWEAAMDHNSFGDVCPEDLPWRTIAFGQTTGVVSSYSAQSGLGEVEVAVVCEGGVIEHFPLSFLLPLLEPAVKRQRLQ